MTDHRHPEGYHCKGGLIQAAPSITVSALVDGSRAIVDALIESPYMVQVLKGYIRL